MKHKRTDGRNARPDLAILGDPQTDESARSLSQCATRESILAGAVLGSAGPGQELRYFAFGKVSLARLLGLGKPHVAHDSGVQ